MATSILPLEASDLPALQILYRSSAAYSTTSYYAVTTSGRGSSRPNTLPDSFHLHLTLLHNQPTVRGGSWIPEESDLDRYKTHLAHGLSFKAVSTSGDITGIIITNYESWNNSAEVYEFIVDKSVQRSGIGMKLMSAVIENAKTRDITRIVCETQTRNTRAISFYLKMGFTLDAVDVSFYGPDDLDKQDVAVFLKYDVNGGRTRMVKDESNSVDSETEKTGLALADCVNSLCPNSGKPVAADSLTIYKGRVVGFCNPHCRDEFANALVVFNNAIQEKGI